MPSPPFSSQLPIEENVTHPRQVLEKMVEKEFILRLTVGAVARRHSSTYLLPDPNPSPTPSERCFPVVC